MTDRQAKSIEEEIEILAQLTGAPTGFVEQVRALFASKAISLEEDVRPFLTALEEAFQREEAIRNSSERARRGIERMQESLGRAQERFRDQAEELKRAIR